MAEFKSLRKFIPRATRYVLRPEDNKLLMFKSQPRMAPKHSTEILNISSTGVAFVTEREIAPQMGEIIKVEFTTLSGDKVAWFGRVVRMAEFEGQSWMRDSFGHPSLDQVTIGLQFEQMPDGHKQNLKKSINQKITKIKKQQRRRHMGHFLKFVSDHAMQAFFYLLCTVATGFLIWGLAKPSDAYDSTKGSPWGTRFSEGGLKGFEKMIEDRKSQRKNSN